MGDINKTTPERGGKVVRTICEVHREIYRKVFSLSYDGKISQEDFDFLSSHLKEAFEYAKKNE